MKVSFLVVSPMYLVSIMKMNVFLKMDFGRARNVSGEGVVEISLQPMLLPSESWASPPPRLPFL